MAFESLGLRYVHFYLTSQLSPRQPENGEGVELSGNRVDLPVTEWIPPVGWELF